MSCERFKRNTSSRALQQSVVGSRFHLLAVTYDVSSRVSLKLVFFFLLHKSTSLQATRGGVGNYFRRSTWFPPAADASFFFFFLLLGINFVDRSLKGEQQKKKLRKLFFFLFLLNSLWHCHLFTDFCFSFFLFLLLSPRRLQVYNFLV